MRNDCAFPIQRKGSEASPVRDDKVDIDNGQGCRKRAKVTGVHTAVAVFDSTLTDDKSCAGSGSKLLSALAVSARSDQNSRTKRSSQFEYVHSRCGIRSCKPKLLTNFQQFRPTKRLPPKMTICAGGGIALANQSAVNCVCCKAVTYCHLANVFPRHARQRPTPYHHHCTREPLLYSNPQTLALS
jgi:hypothetical protein